MYELVLFPISGEDVKTVFNTLAIILGAELSPNRNRVNNSSSLCISQLGIPTGLSILVTGGMRFSDQLILRV